MKVAERRGGVEIRLDQALSCCPFDATKLCRRLSQAVASRETLRNRKVINTKSAHDNQNREPHKNRQQRP